MKRFLTMLLITPLVLVALTTESPAIDPEYGWTISDSDLDPFSNKGPFLPGLLNLKLWYTCNVNDGMSAAQFDLRSVNPANIVLAFTPKNGYLNAGGSTNLLLAVGGCPNGPLNAGDILVLVNAPGEICLGPAADGTKGTVDCSPNPALWPIQWIGYSNDTSNPTCMKDWDDCEKDPVSVEDRSWGGVKSLYR